MCAHALLFLSAPHTEHICRATAQLTDTSFLIPPLISLIRSALAPVRTIYALAQSARYGLPSLVSLPSKLLMCVSKILAVCFSPLGSWSKIPVLPTKSSASLFSASSENLSPSRSISLSHSVREKQKTSFSSSGCTAKRFIFSITSPVILNAFSNQPSSFPSICAACAL